MIILDIETTGLNSKTDEVLQVSIIDGEGRVLFNEYMKPKAERWDAAEAVNGISPAMVENEKPFSHYRERINGIIKGADFVIGYNLFFDFGFLYENGIEKMDNIKIIDVMHLFAKYYGDWNEYHCNFTWKKLIFAAEHFNYKWEENAHNSLGDVLATLFVYRKLIELHGEPVFFEVGKLSFKKGERTILNGKRFFEWEDALRHYRNINSFSEEAIIMKHVGKSKREVYIKEYPAYP